jgi:hypothetical protein
MSDRLPTHLMVGALLRRINDAGGIAMVRARGDAQAGTVLVLIDGIGATRALELGVDANGKAGLVESRAADASEPIDDYWRRRRQRDPDLWVLELEGAGAETAAIEILA